jgi:DNA-binding NtrC family response regulator
MPSIHCILSDPSVAAGLEQSLRREGHRPIMSGSVAEAVDRAADTGIDVVLVESALPGARGLGETLAARGVESVHVLQLGEGGDVEAGASYAEIVAHIRAAVRLSESRTTRAAPDTPPKAVAGTAGPVVVGRSEAIRRVVDTLRKTARTRYPVLLQGESGTGKEVLARFVHSESARADRAFVAVNCAALPHGLVESTLFGHEKGAFTGATQRVPGAFERADCGTLLLDEISEMDLALQAKLLRVVQEMEFTRVGGIESVRVDVRIVATTNRDLASMVDAGTFREDLYYRLSVIPVLVPPLRDRREDIPDLATHFLQQAARDCEKTLSGIAPLGLAILTGHPWPGNVRELAHAVERAVAFADGARLEAEDFMPEKRSLAPWRRPTRPATPENVVAHLTSYSLQAAEEILIERALEATGGNRTRAAELLGIADRTLRSKLNTPRP